MQYPPRLTAYFKRDSSTPPLGAITGVKTLQHSKIPTRTRIRVPQIALQPTRVRALVVSPSGTDASRVRTAHVDAVRHRGGRHVRQICCPFVAVVVPAT
jgi:hypothetical protein